MIRPARRVLPVLLLLLAGLSVAGLLVAEPSTTATATGEATDEAPAPEGPAFETSAAQSQDEAQSMRTPETCGANGALSFLGTGIEEIDPKPVGDGLCDCNVHEDCKRVCGHDRGHCFVGPDCNDPDLTGICQC